MFGVRSNLLPSWQTNKMLSHCVLLKSRRTWLSFEFPHVLWGTTTSHPSSEFWTFRFLLGHVSQRCGPVSLKTVGVMDDVFQVMFVHTIICKIQDSILNTLVCNESRYRCRFNEILAFCLTTKLVLLSPPLSDSPFLSVKYWRSDFQITVEFLKYLTDNCKRNRGIEEKSNCRNWGLMKTRQFNGTVTPCIKVQRPLPLYREN